MNVLNKSTAWIYELVSQKSAVWWLSRAFFDLPRGASWNESESYVLVKMAIMSMM